MNILIIDGQGGQLGAQLVKSIISHFPDVKLTAIGTNAVATSAMLKAGAKNAATNGGIGQKLKKSLKNKDDLTDVSSEESPETSDEPTEESHDEKEEEFDVSGV